jgi:nucleoside-diphosphate-sugar epimerase
MKILFTGASSFTGFWFARELARTGHDVVALFRRAPASYPEETRRMRAMTLAEYCRSVVGPEFGDDAFLDLVGSERWDAVCHHAADVTDYKSPEFDAIRAATRNARNAPRIIEHMQQAGCRRLLVTGTVFEANEGAGSGDLAAVSPYGLSKSLAWQILRFYAQRAGMALGKFVIPNPFGPFEEARFTAFLLRTWIAGKVATVDTPDYVRDNIHVSLLARCYAGFVASLPAEAGIRTLNPSGYVESQGAFAGRVAAEMRSRLRRPCELALAHQTDFPEPSIRINTQPARALVPDWNEAGAWDELAGHYDPQTA